MLQKAKERYGDDLSITWKYFSLEQVNSTQGPDWKVWEQDEDFPSRGMWSFRAAEAARKQGAEKFEAFHVSLLAARHKDRKDIGKMDILEEIATESGLDLEQFRKDIINPDTKLAIGRDHTEAVEEYGVFGTPTIFPGNDSGFYLKLMPAPEGAKALETFETIYRTISDFPDIQEIKQPRKPRRE